MVTLDIHLACSPPATHPNSLFFSLVKTYFLVFLIVWGEGRKGYMHRDAESLESRATDPSAAVVSYPECVLGRELQSWARAISALTS